MLRITQSNVKQGIVYALPFSWWKIFKQSHSSSLVSQNQCTSFPSNLSLPNIDTYPLIDSFIIDFEEDIVNEISEKSQTLYIPKRFISSMILPQAKLGEDYVLVSGAFYNQLVKHYPVSTNHHILGFAFKQYGWGQGERVDKIQDLICPRAQTQVQIVLCTNKTGFLFIGFFPDNGNVLEMIRMVIKELEFIEKKETKIIFVEESAEIVLPLANLPNKSTKDLNQNQRLIMITNLLSQKEPILVEDNELNLSIESTKNNANIGNVLDQLFSEDNEIQRPDHKTVSTGASTPLQFSMNSDYRHDWQFQVKEMLRQKTAEEIQQLRNLANQSVEGDLIMIRNVSKKQMMVELEIIAEQLSELAAMNHKKLKEKEY